MTITTEFETRLRKENIQKGNKLLRKSLLPKVHEAGEFRDSEVQSERQGMEIKTEESSLDFQKVNKEKNELSVKKTWRRTFNQLKNAKKVPVSPALDISAFFKP